MAHMMFHHSLVHLRMTAMRVVHHAHHFVDGLHVILHQLIALCRIPAGHDFGHL